MQTEADFGVFLEGEEIFPNLLQHLNHPEKVKGLYYRRGGKVHFTGNENFLRWLYSSHPRWDVFEVEKYGSKSYRNWN